MNLLRRGDLIGVVAPGSPVPIDILKRGIGVLKKIGFDVKLGKHVYDVREFTAGTPLNRAYDINMFFSDTKVKAIIAARGGYNCNQVIPYLDFNLIKKNPKFFFGLSDVTSILNAISIKAGITTFHSPTILMIGGGKDRQAFSKFSRNNFMETVFGLKRNYIKIKNAKRKWIVLKNGKAKGRLFGGNLESIVSILGTRYEPEWRNNIFFWECVDDKIERVSQFLTHLKLAKVYDKISGMIIGRPIKIDLNGKKYSNFKICKMITELLKAHNFPIIYGVDFGHVSDNIVLPIGGDVSFETKNDYIKILKY